MSLSAAAIDLSKEVATEEELKNFFPDSPFRKSQRMTMEEAEPEDLEHLKQVFSDPSPTKKASVNSETFGTLNCPAELAGMAPELAERLSSLQMKDLKRVFSEPTQFPPPAIPEEPSQLQVEETKEEEQRADELRHNVAVRRANLALQREMHPYVIRATAVKYLRLVVKLKNQIADEMKRTIALNIKTGKVTEPVPGVPELLKANPSFVKGVEETLDAMEKKLTLLIEEQNETLLPTPADLAAQVQQVLALLAETFEISQ